MREILLTAATVALVVCQGQPLESASALDGGPQAEIVIQANASLSSPVSHAHRGCASRELVQNWTCHAQWFGRTANAATSQPAVNLPVHARLSSWPFPSLQASAVRWQI